MLEKCDFIGEMLGELKITFQSFLYFGKSDNSGFKAKKSLRSH